jgi:hypothetical protein
LLHLLMRTPSDGSREIGEEGIEESLLDEIVGKLINEGKLEKAASICTFVSPDFFSLFYMSTRLSHPRPPTLHRQAIQPRRPRPDDRARHERHRGRLRFGQLSARQYAHPAPPLARTR